MFLLAAAALASPLDEAAQTGRPVVVLVERGDRDRHPAFWLLHAAGKARSRIDAVTLVLATPEELAAWTGQPVDSDVDLVLLDTVYHKLLGAKRVVPGSLGSSNAASGAVLGPGVFPGELDRSPGRLSAGQAWEAMGGTVSAWDGALRSLLPRDLQTSPPLEGRPVVLGAAWCQDHGCGVSCEVRSGDGRSCGMGHVDALSVDLLMRWDPP